MAEIKDGLIGDTQKQIPENTPTKTEKSIAEKIKRERVDLFKNIVLITAAIIIFRYVFCVTLYHGNAMYPSIKDGDLCVAFRPGNISMGNVVIYKENGKKKVGRIAATEGHEVNVTDDGFMIDGSPQYQNVLYETTAEGVTVSLPMQVVKDSFFILNDYREDASDSRTHGLYKDSDIQGNVVLVLRGRGF